MGRFSRSRCTIFRHQPAVLTMTGPSRALACGARMVSARRGSAPKSDRDTASCEVVRRVEGGVSARQVARVLQVTNKTVRRWVARARTGAALTDRSSRPHQSSPVTPQRAQCLRCEIRCPSSGARPRLRHAQGLGRRRRARIRRRRMSGALFGAQPRPRAAAECALPCAQFSGARDERGVSLGREQIWTLKQIIDDGVRASVT